MSKSTRISPPGMGRPASKTGILAGILFLSASLWTGCQNDGPTQNNPSNTNTNTATMVAAKCAADSVPVCGADGISYRNACAAWEIGKTEVKSQGICAGQTTPVEPWWTSSNTEEPILCGTKPPQNPVLEDPIDPVDPGDVFDGTCKDKFPEDIAIKCTSDLDPVCGCDGKSYVNACQAMGIGHVYAASKGACPGDPIIY